MQHLLDFSSDDGDPQALSDTDASMGPLVGESSGESGGDDRYPPAPSGISDSSSDEDDTLVRTWYTDRTVLASPMPD